MLKVKEKASSKGFCKMATVAMVQMMFEMPCAVKAAAPMDPINRFSAAPATAVMKASAWTAKAAKLQALFAKSWDLNSSMRLGVLEIQVIGGVLGKNMEKQSDENHPSVPEIHLNSYQAQLNYR